MTFLSQKLIRRKVRTMFQAPNISLFSLPHIIFYYFAIIYRRDQKQRSILVSQNGLLIGQRNFAKQGKKIMWRVIQKFLLDIQTCTLEKLVAIFKKPVSKWKKVFLPSFISKYQKARRLELMRKLGTKVPYACFEKNFSEICSKENDNWEPPTAL